MGHVSNPEPVTGVRRVNYSDAAGLGHRFKPEPWVVYVSPTGFTWGRVHTTKGIGDGEEVFAGQTKYKACYL